MKNNDPLLEAGVKCILALYGDKQSDNLHELRHLKYMQGISEGKPVDLAILLDLHDHDHDHDHQGQFQGYH